MILPPGITLPEVYNLTRLQLTRQREYFNCKVESPSNQMSASISTPSNKKVNWVQKYSLKKYREWEGSKSVCNQLLSEVWLCLEPQSAKQ